MKRWSVYLCILFSILDHIVYCFIAQTIYKQLVAENIVKKKLIAVTWA